MSITISTLDDYIDDLAGSNSGSYTDAKKHRSMTRWMHNLTAEVMEAMSDSDFQGEISTHDLVVNRREYLFPTDLLKIKRIDLKLDGSNWYKASRLDESQIGDNYASEADIVERFTNTDPFVSYFDNSYFIYSGTIIDVTDGIKITYDKAIVGETSAGVDITSFTADDDVTNLPEFAQMFLVYGACKDHFLDKTDDKQLQKFNLLMYGNGAGRPAETRQIGGLLRQIINYYTNRSPDEQMSFSTTYSEEDFE